MLNRNGAICKAKPWNKRKYNSASLFLLPLSLVSQWMFWSQTISLPLSCLAASHTAASLCLILRSHIRSYSPPGHTHTHLPFLCPCKPLLVLNGVYCETNSLRVKCAEMTKWMGKGAQVQWHECVCKGSWYSVNGRGLLPLHTRLCCSWLRVKHRGQVPGNGIGARRRRKVRKSGRGDEQHD